ncbi:MAG: imidazole glycerol phosphate synthase subunit HisH [Acidimicrobiales bacterium]
MIAVLDYGIGNLRSAEKALQAVGGDARLVTDPEQAAAATAVVLPGVGAFGSCMEALDRTGLGRAAIDGVESGRPFLGICVGMQLLYEGSQESPGVAGLGVLPGVVERLPAGVTCPQMQWNRLDVRDEAHPLMAGLGRGAWMYFVHSFSAPMSDQVVATCDYGGPVPAVVSRGALWATQFHPEKSSSDGLRLLANFVAAVDAAAAAGAVDAGGAARAAGPTG